MQDVLSDAVGIARLVLIVVFALAGWAKLSDRSGTRQAVLQFGVPDPLAHPVAALLPLAEITMAGLLLSSGSAVVGAVGAATVLGLFVVAMAANLARGRRPDCHCFGQVRSEPVGFGTVARNAVLIALTALIIADGRGGTNAWDWFTDLSHIWVVVVAAVAVYATLRVFASSRTAPGSVGVNSSRLTRRGSP